MTVLLINLHAIMWILVLTIGFIGDCFGFRVRQIIRNRTGNNPGRFYSCLMLGIVILIMGCGASGGGGSSFVETPLSETAVTREPIAEIDLSHVVLGVDVVLPDAQALATDHAGCGHAW